MTGDDLAALHAACFEFPRPWSAEEFAGLMADPMVFIETSEGGMAVGRVVLDEAELLTICIDPEKRLRGAGRALLDRFAATAVSRGAQTAFLEVAADNKAAISLYLTAGFVESGRRKNYYAKPDGTRVDALVMFRPLAPC